MELLMCLLLPALALGAVDVQMETKDGVESYGMDTLYANDDAEVFNQVVDGMEDSELLQKATHRTRGGIEPLNPQDVKCMMSVDKYCSKDMLRIKNVIITAVITDCKDCSNEDKTKAGQVIAALMAHDPVAWKLFLTRTAVLVTPQKREHTIKPLTRENSKMIGVPEVLPASKGRFLLPEFKLRVERYAIAVKNKDEY